MTVAQNKVVLVHYTLTENDANGEVIESTENRDPLAFISGIGMMIPAFEAHLQGMKAGDKFAFAIKAGDAYGEFDENAIVQVPKGAFETEGNIPEGLLDIGNVLPMRDQEGNHFEGAVVAVDDAMVTLDFNHPMAGVDLFFTGHIHEVRDAQPEELAHGHVHGPGGHQH
ncbi:MAG: peptidylprolyl isomerase [Saprospiraceae bacterium]